MESALRVLAEDDRVLASNDEKIMRAWNLEALAEIALMQERLNDAFEIRTRQVKMAREAAYRRVLGLALTGLGSVHTAAGRLEAANQANSTGWRSLSTRGRP